MSDEFIFEGNSAPAQKALRELVDELDAAGISITNLQKQMQKVDGNAAVVQLQGLNKNLDNVRVTLKQTANGFETLKVETTRNLEAIAAAQARAQAKAQREIEKARKEAEKELAASQRESDARYSSYFRAALGANLVARAISGISNELKQAAASALEFDRQVQRIQVQTGAKGIASTSFDLASRFNQRPEDVAAALQRTLTSGVGSAPQVAESASKLAQLTGTDVAQTTNVLVGALKAFNLQGDQAAKVSESLSRAWGSGIPLTNEFASSLAKTSTIAKQMGISLNEEIAYMAAFQKRGIDATQSGDVLGNVLIRLSNPSEILKQKFAELGQTTAQGVIQQYGLAKAFELVFSDTSDANQVVQEFSNTLGGQKTSLIELAGVFKDVDAELKRVATGIDTLGQNLDTVRSGSGERFSSWINTLRVGLKEEATRLDNPAALLSNFPGLGPLLGFAADRVSNFVNRNIEVDRQKTAEMKEAAIDKSIPSAFQAGITGAFGGVSLRNVMQAQQARLVQWNLEQRELDKTRTQDFTSELEIRFHRFEDSIKKQEEVARKAQDLRKQSAGRVQDLQDSLETGRFERQIGLLTDQQRQQATLGSIFNGFVDINGRGNPIANRIALLEQQRRALFQGAAKGQGDQFLDSKDIERALNKSKELDAVYKQQFDVVAQMYRERKVGAEAVETAERKITDNAKEQVSLENQLQAKLKEKEESAKRQADAERKRGADVLNATKDALKISFLDEKGNPKFADQNAMLKQFDVLATKASAGAGNVAELQAIVALLGGRREQLVASATREQGVSKATALAASSAASEKEQEEMLRAGNNPALVPGAVKFMEGVYQKVLDAISGVLNQKSSSGEAEAALEKARAEALAAAQARGDKVLSAGSQASGLNQDIDKAMEEAKKNGAKIREQQKVSDILDMYNTIDQYSAPPKQSFTPHVMGPQPAYTENNTTHEGTTIVINFSPDGVYDAKSAAKALVGELRTLNRQGRINIQDMQGDN